MAETGPHTPLRPAPTLTIRAARSMHDASANLPSPAAPRSQICFVGDCGAAQPLFCYNCGYQVGYRMCFASPPPPPPLDEGGQEDEPAAAAASMTALLATESARGGRANRTNHSTNASTPVS